MESGKKTIDEHKTKKSALKNNIEIAKKQKSHLEKTEKTSYQRTPRVS